MCIRDSPEDLWGQKAGGFVFWQQILHTLTGLNFWMRLEKTPFTEPFSGKKIYPELDKAPEDVLSKMELREYKEQVAQLCNAFFEGKDDAWLRQASVLYGKISNLDVVMMQVRHMQYHVGHCNSILRERGVEAVAWMEYFGE
jgi:uncharacterized damage-inducible protein DinB